MNMEVSDEKQTLVGSHSAQTCVINKQTNIFFSCITTNINAWIQLEE